MYLGSLVSNEYLRLSKKKRQVIQPAFFFILIINYKNKF